MNSGRFAVLRQAQDAYATLRQAPLRQAQGETLRRAQDAKDDTLGPDNGGVSGPDYSDSNDPFGGRLPGPFSAGAGIELSA